MAQSEGRGLRWPPTKARLKSLIVEATVDAYDETEQRVGFYTLIDAAGPEVSSQILRAVRRLQAARGLRHAILPVLDARCDARGPLWLNAHRLGGNRETIERGTRLRDRVVARVAAGQITRWAKRGPRDQQSAGNNDYDGLVLRHWEVPPAMVVTLSGSSDGF